MLRQREVNFVVSLLRERFTDCLIIGRDLLRLLQIVARIPEIEQLWRDILVNPRSLAPTFTGQLRFLSSLKKIFPYFLRFTFNVKCIGSSVTYFYLPIFTTVQQIFIFLNYLA